MAAPSGLNFYTSTAGFPVLGCSNNKCGTSTPQASICLELVPAGSAPGACLAQALATTANNPMVLYAKSADGSVDGYVKVVSSVLTPYAVSSVAVHPGSAGLQLTSRLPTRRLYSTLRLTAMARHSMTPTRWRREHTKRSGRPFTNRPLP